MQNNREKCVSLVGEDNFQTTDECTDLLLRNKRSTVDKSIDINQEIIQTTNKARRSQKQRGGTTRRPSQSAFSNFKKNRRSRRRHEKLQISANRRGGNEFCQVKPLYISFELLGWGKWIVAPKGLNANFCEGTCPFPLTSVMTSSNHAVLQSVSSFYNPDTVKAPCCVPQNLARMTILYHQDEKIVTMRNYDNMMVETCGCR